MFNQIEATSVVNAAGETRSKLRLFFASEKIQAQCMGTFGAHGEPTVHRYGRDERGYMYLEVTPADCVAADATTVQEDPDVDRRAALRTLGHPELETLRAELGLPKAKGETAENLISRVIAHERNSGTGAATNKKA